MRTSINVNMCAYRHVYACMHACVYIDTRGPQSESSTKNPIPYKTYIEIPQRPGATGQPPGLEAGVLEVYRVSKIYIVMGSIGSHKLEGLWLETFYFSTDI